MSLRRGATAVIVSAACSIALVATAMTAQPTTAVWEDRGGSAITVTAAAAPPPPMDAPIVATNAQTVLHAETEKMSGQNYLSEPTPIQFCFTEEVTTTSAADAPWSLTMHTLLRPFNGAKAADFYTMWEYGVTQAADYATSGDLIVTPTRADQYASTTKPYMFKFCVNTPEPAWVAPGATTYELTGLALSVDGLGRPCVTAVTTGHTKYFVRFTATFDYKALLDRELAAQRISPAQYGDFIDNVYWQSQEASGATGSNYSVTLTGYNSLNRSVREATSISLTSCSY